MKYAFVTVESGYVRDVEFFDDPGQAVLALAEFAAKMNCEKEDGAVFSPEGLVANADHLLKWHESVFKEAVAEPHRRADGI